MQSVQSHFNQKSTVIDQILLTSRFEDVPLLASNVLFRQFEKFFAFAACSSNAGGPGLGWLSPISKHLILNLVVSIQCYHDFSVSAPTDLHARAYVHGCVWLLSRLPTRDMRMRVKLPVLTVICVAKTVPQLPHFQSYSGCCSADSDIAYCCDSYV